MKTLYIHPRKQHGQAMTETVVAMFALVPLFLITSVLIKYGDIALTTTTASRYLAFEWAMYDNWSPQDKEDKDEVMKYFFKDKDKVWVDYKGNKLLADDVQVGGKEGRFNTWAAKYNYGAPGSPHYRRVSIDVTIAKLPWDDEGRYQQMVMHREAATGFNDWSAKNPDDLLFRITTYPWFSGRKPGNGVPEGFKKGYGMWNVMQVWTAKELTVWDYELEQEVTYPFPLPALQTWVRMLENNPFIIGSRPEMPEIWHEPDVELVPDDRK